MQRPFGRPQRDGSPGTKRDCSTAKIRVGVAPGTACGEASEGSEGGRQEKTKVVDIDHGHRTTLAALPGGQTLRAGVMEMMMAVVVMMMTMMMIMMMVPLVGGRLSRGDVKRAEGGE